MKWHSYIPLSEKMVSTSVSETSSIQLHLPHRSHWNSTWRITTCSCCPGARSCSHPTSPTSTCSAATSSRWKKELSGPWAAWSPWTWPTIKLTSFTRWQNETDTVKNCMSVPIKHFLSKRIKLRASLIWSDCCRSLSTASRPWRSCIWTIIELRRFSLEPSHSLASSTCWPSPTTSWCTSPTWPSRYSHWCLFRPHKHGQGFHG